MANPIGNSRLLDGQEIKNMVSCALAFDDISCMAEEKIKNMNLENASMNRIGDSGWIERDVWESYSISSHYNLHICFELLLKAILSLDQHIKNSDGHKIENVPRGHRLARLYEKLAGMTQKKLESVWKLLHHTETELVAFVDTRSINQSQYPKNRNLDTFHDWLIYFDTDLQMNLKRYSWENLHVQNLRHYVSDLSTFHNMVACMVALIWDKGEEVGVFKGRQSPTWRRGFDFLRQDVSEENLRSFYEDNGWNKNQHGLWVKKRRDGCTIIVSRPDMFWRYLIKEGEQSLTVEEPYIHVAQRRRGSQDKFSEPIAIAELLPNEDDRG